MLVRVLQLATALCLLPGCATLVGHDGIHCYKDSDMGCEVFDFAMASERTLRSNGPSIAVECPWHFDATSAEQILPECKTLMQAAVDHLRGRLAWCLVPIEPEQITYKEGGGWIDSVHSGRQYTSIVASLPLSWQKDSRCR